MDATAQSGEGGAEPRGPVRLVVVMRHAQVYRPAKHDDLCEHDVPATFPKKAGDASSTGRGPAGGDDCDGGEETGHGDAPSGQVSVEAGDARATRDRSHDSDHPECAQCEWGSLSWTGAREARAVGDRLAETLVDTFARCEVTVYHAGTHETTRTAEIIAERVDKAAERLEGDPMDRRSLTLVRPAQTNALPDERVRSSVALGKLVRRGAGAGGADEKDPIEAVYDETGVQVPKRDWKHWIRARVEWFVGSRAADSSAVDGATITRVVVLVANDPAASWLLHRLSEADRLFSTPWLHHPSRLPIRRGEGVALEHLRLERPFTRIRTVWRPVWAVSPGSSELIKELQAKIRSKMDSAKQLGAFVTALVTFAVTRVLAAIHREDDPLEGGYQAWAWIGVGILAVGAVGFFVTLYRYDSLLMPTEAWAAVRSRKDRPRSGVFARPPSPASWVLFQNMMLIWRRAFTVAILATGAGATMVAVSLAAPNSGVAWILIISIVVPAAIAGALVWWGSRPVLGVTD